jgi:hypothetical protein
VAATGTTPEFYSNYSGCSRVASDPRMASYPLWLAFPGDGIHLPASPPPWTAIRLWQYTTGVVSGISGNVDEDVNLGLFSSGGGSLGGDGLDMATAAEILAAVTMPMPPLPASIPSTYQPSDYDYVIQTRSWDQIKSSFGADGEAWLYEWSHRRTIADALAAMQIEQAVIKAELDALKTGQPVDLSGVLAAQAKAQAAIDAIKAEEDSVKAQLAKDLAP